MNTYKYIIITILSINFYTATTSASELASNIIAGGLTGAAEVAFPGQLFSYAMNKKIAKEPIVWSQSYKGAGVNAVSMMPITAIQKGTAYIFNETIENTQQSPTTQGQKTAISFAAGVCGALVDTPANAIQLYLQQQKNSQKSTFQAIKDLGTKSMRGFTANATKEGVFTVGYQLLSPTLTRKTQEYVGNNAAASSIGGIGAGIITAIATQPAAVVRNVMQADMNKVVYKNTWQTIRKIHATQGLKGFFAGLPQRGSRVAIAIPLYDLYSRTLQNYFTKKDTSASSVISTSQTIAPIKSIEPYCPYHYAVGASAAATAIGICVYGLYRKKPHWFKKYFNHH